jgi:methionine-rich copper-binding protein CopC
MTLPLLRAIGLAGALATAAFFHNKLEKSAPAADEKLAAAPKEIRLWFQEKPEAALTTIAVVGSDSTKVATGKVHTTDDPLSVAAAVTGPMAPGGYFVRWKTSGKDGHVIKGSYSFRIGK